MSDTPGQLPPPPPGQPSGEVPPPPPPAMPAASPTQVAGQQVAPSTPVPHVPASQLGTQAGSTNTMAVVSLVAALASIPGHILPLVGPFSLSVIAIITGLVARSQIRRTGEQGSGFATAGIIIGVVHLALLVALIILVLVVVFIFGIAMFGYSRSH